jgi:uncharacterized protein Yka (UPF0111/DUF47 family)
MGKDAKKPKKLTDLFLENADIIEQILSELNRSIMAYTTNNESVTKTSINAVIQLEKRQDRLRERTMEAIFSAETLVFSRSDRVFLANGMDNIGDDAEIVARKLKLYRPSPIPEVFSVIQELGGLLAEIGVQMKGLFDAILKDFSKGKAIIIKIQELRRTGRDKHWDLMEKIYAADLTVKDFTFYLNLTKNLAKVADRCEEFADDIYGLICKYTV